MLSMIVYLGAIGALFIAGWFLTCALIVFSKKFREWWFGTSTND